MKIREDVSDKLLIGWQEWCSLPGLGIPLLKAKIDTGAKTSAIHAFDFHRFTKSSRDLVKFRIHPLQGTSVATISCIAPIIDIRPVMSSNGHKETRIVVLTPLVLGDKSWDIEVTLSNRDPLRFRLLLGREALKNRVIIDPHRACCLGDISKKDLRHLYHAQIKHEPRT
jgi:ribosomal protein S6--L-glutamate ligase